MTDGRTGQKHNLRYFVAWGKIYSENATPIDILLKAAEQRPDKLPLYYHVQYFTLTSFHKSPAYRQKSLLVIIFTHQDRKVCQNQI